MERLPPERGTGTERSYGHIHSFLARAYRCLPDTFSSERSFVSKAERKISGRSSTPKGCDVKKLALFGLVAGALFAVILLVRKGQSSGSPRDREQARQEKRRAMFDKMQAGMDALPDDFPPVVMFNNVAATRENAERILELLEKDRSGTEEPVASAAK